MSIRMIALVIWAMVLCVGKIHAQEPVLTVKDITPSMLLDGTKAPLSDGWEAVTTTGKASVANGEILLSCLNGQQYTFRATATTGTPFITTGDYTIEFRIKVPVNNGRGFDMVVRDQVGRTSIGISHEKIVVTEGGQVLANMDGSKYHTYRFSCKRSQRKMYLYIDGVYVIDLTMTSNSNGPDLQFGKGNTASVSDIYIDYIAVDATGAYKAVKTYSVNFESNGGSALPEKVVAENALLAKPADPTRAGYGFVGWYTDAAFTTPWNFAADKVTAAATLYAKWDNQQYTVSFNSNGGSPVTEVQTGYYNAAVTEPATPVRTGFMFGGWYKDAALTQVFDFTSDRMTGNLVLYAKWNDRNQTISFPAITTKSFSDGAFDLAATASSGLPVTYEVVSGNVELAGNTLSIEGAGAVTIKATQAGDAFYFPATPVEVSFNITKGTQKITMEQIGTVNRFAGIVPLVASSDAGLPLRITVSDPLVADYVNGKLLVKGLGTTTITAYQEGNDNYLPADTVSITVKVFTNARYSKILVKDAVSPNGDGINDVFLLEGIADYPENRVQVMNRAGVTVFDGRGYNNSSVVFNGNSKNGQRLPGGTYYYHIDVKIAGQWQQMKGFLVIRY
jgi:uncharacterized repeat protein (TIGR02543 family)/gliding motility-associated-like protein